MKKKRVLSPFAFISVLLFILVEIIYVLSNLYPTFADLVNSTISQDFRRLMASFSSRLPFSLFEQILICLPIILFFRQYYTLYQEQSQGSENRTNFAYKYKHA